MSGVRDVVDPSEVLEQWRAERNNRDMSHWGSEAVLLAMALQEVDAQLAEAEQLLHDLGYRTVRVDPAAIVPRCARTPSGGGS